MLFTVNVDLAIVMSRSGLLHPSEILDRIFGVHQLLKATLVIEMNAFASLQSAMCL